MSLLASFKLFFVGNSFEDFFETLVILSTVLLTIKSPIATVVF